MIAPATIAECKSFDPQIWSDLHKDAYGFRPRMDLSHLDAQQLDKLWDTTCVALDDEIRREADQKSRAIAAFEGLLDDTAEAHGVDQGTALRWLMQGENLPFEPHEMALGHFLWKHGIVCMRYQMRLVQEFWPGYTSWRF